MCWTSQLQMLATASSDLMEFYQQMQTLRFNLYLAIPSIFEQFHQQFHHFRNLSFNSWTVPSAFFLILDTHLLPIIFSSNGGGTSSQVLLSIKNLYSDSTAFFHSLLFFHSMIGVVKHILTTLKSTGIMLSAQSYYLRYGNSCELTF